MMQKPVDTRRHPMTLRVTFAFDAEGVIEVRSKEHVEMIAPPSPAPIPDLAAGTLVELRNADELAVFRRVVHDPLRTVAEHFSPDGTIEAVERPAQGGEFEVMLPLVEGATHGVLVPGERPDLVPRQAPVRFGLEEDAPEEKERQS